MTTIKENLKDKETVYFIAALAVIGVALMLPSSIALVLTSLFFALFAFFRPQQSLLFLVVYVSIRPFLVEVNPGLKLIGDLITFIAFAKVIIAGRKDWKSLFSFKWFEWAFFAFLLFGAVSGLVQGVLPSAVIFQLRTFIIMYLLYYTSFTDAVTGRMVPTACMGNRLDKPNRFSSRHYRKTIYEAVPIARCMEI